MPHVSGAYRRFQGLTDALNAVDSTASAKLERGEHGLGDLPAPLL